MPDDTRDDGAVYCCDPSKNPDCPREHCAYDGRGGCFSTADPARAQTGVCGPCVNYNINPWRDDSPPPEPDGT